ncbi:MAG: FG-GAP-like repeat-containing protein [Verrucomicrobiota bacterium]
MKSPTPLILILTAVLSVGVYAAPAPAGNNIIPNGDFHGDIITKDNLWDGVDSSGYLRGNLNDPTATDAQIRLLQYSGAVGDSVLPVSVAVADLNGDGLPDLIASNSWGYVFVFFNSGTPTEPKFTNSEFFPLSLFRGFYTNNQGIDTHKSEIWRLGPRISLYDWNHTGRFDLAAGNYRGELLFFPNTGSKTAPDFLQPKSLDMVNMLSIKKPWGNLFAPLAYDFDRDGKTDIAVGEASYSANSIHLFLNRGTNTQPRFDENANCIVAYGDGREQLVPTLADYNGDGFMDILVADREGHVSVYLNPGKGWKPGVEYKFSNFINFASSDRLYGALAISTGDLNGDGLFDLIIGKTNGRIALAVNKGTKEQPKFDSPVDLKGTDIWASNIKLPTTPLDANPNVGPNQGHYKTGWFFDTGFYRGNPYGYFSVITNQDDPAAAIPADRHALKAAYFPAQNKVFKTSVPIFPGADKGFLDLAKPGAFFGNSRTHWAAQGPRHSTFLSPSNQFTMRYILVENEIKPGKSYHLSFNIKGNNVTDGIWKLAFHGRTKSEEKQTHGDRGSVQKEYVDLKTEQRIDEGTFTASPNWTTVNKTIQVRFKEADLRKPDRLDAIMAVFELQANLKPGNGVLYLDDVQLVEIP